MKDIVIVANFVSGLDGTDNNRFSYLAMLLAREHQVELVTSDFHHAKKQPRQLRTGLFPFKITMLHEPGYQKNVSLQRFYSHYIFGKNVRKYLQIRKTPDLIYCAVPSLDAAQAAAAYAREKGVRFFVDVQDLWPEAFKMVFRMPVVSDLLFAPMMRQADAIYRQADGIIAVSQTYCQRAKEVNQKCDTVHTVFLGTRLADFDRFAEENRVTDKPEDELWLGYCGTLGSSYDLICVLRALELIRERGVRQPRFVILGDGPRKTEFEQFAKERDLNAAFWGRIPYAQMCGVLRACDIVVNPIVRGAAQSIINKHADYAASGKPVLNTQESEEYRNLVEAYHMGFNCKNGDPEDLADKLVLLLREEELRREMGRNARRCARECFDREQTYGEILKMVRMETSG